MRYGLVDPIAGASTVIRPYADQYSLSETIMTRTPPVRNSGRVLPRIADGYFTNTSVEFRSVNSLI